jgi:PEP-CTERM motif
MFNKSIVPLSLACFCMLGSIGRSAIVLRVDMDLDTPGIQPNLVGSEGSTVTAGLFMELTGNTSVATFNYSVQFDTNELLFVSRSETPDVLTGLSELDASNPNNSPAGILRRFDGGTFASGPVGPFGPVKIGQLVFTAIAPSGTLSDIDILPGRFEPLFDSFFDNGFNEVTSQVTFFGGSFSPSVIPEPTSMGLVMVGCAIGAFGWRRRASNN